MKSKNLFSIKNKVVFLTGALGLFGSELSDTFLTNGAKVVLCGHNKKKLALKKVELLKKYNKDQFLLVHLEITKQSSIKSCIKKAIKKFGKIDILINNASIDRSFNKKSPQDLNSIRFEDYPFESIQKLVEVNMLGTIQITQLVCKQMVKQGHGNIINIGSIYSLLAPNPKLYQFDEVTNYKPVDYVVSKSFIPNFTRYIATLYGKLHIKCNAICPHGILHAQKEAFLDNFEDLSPIGRMAYIEEINGSCIFLMSEASSYMTGQTLVLDGGWSAV